MLPLFHHKWDMFKVKCKNAKFTEKHRIFCRSKVIQFCLYNNTLLMCVWLCCQVRRDNELKPDGPFSSSASVTVRVLIYYNPISKASLSLQKRQRNKTWCFWWPVFFLSCFYFDVEGNRKHSESLHISQSLRFRPFKAFYPSCAATVLVQRRQWICWLHHPDRIKMTFNLG